MQHAESLESRRLLSTVVQTLPGYYKVTGTDGDDVIGIEVDQAISTFTLDGATYGGVLHLSIVALAGNDTVTVGGTAGGPIAAVIQGGPGQDVLTLNMNGAVWGDGDHDEIKLRNSFRGEAYGGGGDDYISVYGDSIETQLEGNEGNDTIWALDNRYGVVLFGGPGNDRLYGSPFDDVIFDGSGSDWLFGLGGNDEFHSRDGSPDWIMGGAGYDTLWCDTVEGGISGSELINYG